MNEDKIIKEMKKYNSDQFSLYMAEAGWEEWMNEYTESDEGEEATEKEIKSIEAIQEKLWDEVHEEK